MQRSSNAGANSPYGATDRLSSASAATKVSDAAQSAHQSIDKVSERTSSQIDRLNDTAHRAVDKAADATVSAAQWASSLREQANQAQTKITEAACTSIRARPIVSVAGALAVGYLIGRLARP